MVIKQKTIRLLRWCEKYFKTDMLYAARGSFWILMGRIGMYAVSFLTMAAFSRYVTKETYGTYQYVISLVAVFGILALPGVNTALVRSVARKKEGTIRLAIKTKLKSSLIGSFLLAVIALWQIYKGNTETGAAILVGAVFFPARQTFVIYQNFWQGRMRFDIKTKYSIISAAFSAAVLIPVIYMNRSTAEITFALFFSLVLIDGIMLLKTLKSLENNTIDDEAIPYGKHLSVMKSLSFFTQYLDRIIVWSFLGPFEVAVYSFAYLPIEKLRQACPVSALSLPKLSEKNISVIKPGIFSKTKTLFLITLPITALVILLAPYIYRFLFPEYMSSVPYFQALAGLIALTPFHLMGSALTAAKQQKALYILNTAVPIAKIILFLTLVPFFQIWGIVFSLLGGTFISGMLTLYFFSKI